MTEQCKSKGEEKKKKKKKKKETIHVFLDMSGKEIEPKKKSFGYYRHYINKFNKLSLI